MDNVDPNRRQRVALGGRGDRVRGEGEGVVGDPQTCTTAPGGAP